LIRRFSQYTRARNFQEFRPQVPVRGHAIRWWRFAVRSVCKSLEERRDRWRWNTIRQGKQDRLRYMALYEEKLVERKLTSAGERELLALDQRLHIDTVLLFRQMAVVLVTRRVQKQEELRTRRRQQRKSEHQLERKEKGEMAAWFSNTFKKIGDTIDDSQSSSELPPVELTQEVWRDLYEAVGLSKSSLATSLGDSGVPSEASPAGTSAASSLCSSSGAADPHNLDAHVTLSYFGFRLQAAVCIHLLLLLLLLLLFVCLFFVCVCV
jgi:Vacuolar sorting-associated protein 13, extended-chorein